VLSALLCALVLGLWAFLCLGRLHEDDRFRLAPAPPPAGDPPGGPIPEVSVLIPARNEAHQIAGCIASLRAQTLPPKAIVVVDDGSTDGTAGVVRGLASGQPHDGVPVILVEGGAHPPEGWIGKSHAIVQGLPRATGAWLLFTDADTVHAPGALASAVGHARRHGLALLSLTGDQRAVGAWEKIVQPLVFRLLDVLYPMPVVNGPDPQRAAANGIYLLVRRDAYEAVGTHAAFRDEVLEDVAIAQAVRRAGFRTAFLRGDALLSVRMYRDLRPLWEGWAKNLWPLLGRDARRCALAAAGVIAAGVLPAAMLWYGGAAGWAAAIGAFGAEAWLRWRDRSDVSYTLTLPLGALILAAMIAESARRHPGGGGISWKGRRYPSSP
jgi:glycosyltransferase involved in cell wall biosynthesis